MLLATGIILGSACEQPPSAAQASEPDPQPAPPAAAEPDPTDQPARARARDPHQLLARARAGMHGGRVPASIQRELLGSDHGHHRHAVRLLQSIAGETPAKIVSRWQKESPGPEVATARAAEAEPKPNPDPDPETEPEADPQTEPEPEAEAEPEPEPDPAPTLASLPLGSPAHEWFASGQVELEPIQPDTAPIAAISTRRLLGPEPLLLERRPPAAALAAALGSAAGERGGEGPRLVILTSVALRERDGGIDLDLAGAGAVAVGVQPLGPQRVRLWTADAGAVPGFLGARPARPELEIVDIRRREDVIELELELAAGWDLVAVSTLDNGARIRFEPEVHSAP